MALTLNEFCGFETGGLEEAEFTFGSPDATEATTVRTGVRSLAMTTSSDSYYRLSVGSKVSDAGNGHIVGVAVYSTDFAPSGGDVTLLRGQAGQITVFLESDGDIRVVDSASTTLFTATAPLTTSAWNYIEVYISGWATSGITVTLFVGGTQVGSSSSANTSATAATTWSLGYSSSGFTNADATMYFDDFYILTGATAASQRLTGSSGTDTVHVKGYQSAVASATDNGSALDFGTTPTWAETGDLPFDNSNRVGYEANNLNGSTDTDSGSRAGPSGDSDVTGGTIKGAKWLFTASRTAGSNSSPFLRYGDDGGTTDVTDGAGITLGTEDPPTTVFQFLSESTNVPSTSQVFRLGMGKGSGGRDIMVGDAIGTLLYTQAGGEPPAVVLKSVGRGLIHSVLIDRRQLVH